MDAIFATVGVIIAAAIRLAATAFENFVFIILPWLVTPKNIASIGDDNNYIVEMPDEE